MPERIKVDRLVGAIQSDILIKVTNGPPQSIKAGKYVAVRQDKQETGAYRLFHADEDGNSLGDHVASVYLTMRSDGNIEIG